MRVIEGNELLGGSDREFVVNLYARVLNRWPDEEGYLHYLARIEGKPDKRRETIEEIAASEEARSLGVQVRFDDAPAKSTAPAPDAAPDTRPASSAPPVQPPLPFTPAASSVFAAVPALLSTLATEVAALRRQVAALAETPKPTSGPDEELRSALARLEDGIVRLRADLAESQRAAAAALQTAVETRLSALERRLSSAFDGRDGP